ncbi:MAG: hypothetical protein H7Y17_17375 [Chlorobia bacterium]|nr:hypothetical protein [Fimbriimonadaceae bacterium]
MVLTTLIGLWAIGAPAQQTPIQVTIETKVFKVEDEALALEGVKVSTRSAPGKSPIIVKYVSLIDEQKLAQNKGMKLISSPVLRTIDGVEAKLTIQNKIEGQGTVTWMSTMTPAVRIDGTIDLDWLVGEESIDVPLKNWRYIYKPHLKDGEPHGLYINRRGEKFLYVVKATASGPKRSDAKIRVTYLTGSGIQFVSEGGSLKSSHDVISADGVKAETVLKSKKLLKQTSAEFSLVNEQWKEMSYGLVADQPTSPAIREVAFRVRPRDTVSMHFAVEVMETSRDASRSVKFREDFHIGRDRACILIVKRSDIRDVYLFELIDRA